MLGSYLRERSKSTIAYCISLLLIGSALTGCATYSKCEKKFGTKSDTVFVEKTVIKTTTVNGDTATLSIAVDSLSSVVATDTTKFLSLYAYIDSLKRLHVKGITKTIYVHDTVNVKVPYTVTRIFVDTTARKKLSDAKKQIRAEHLAATQARRRSLTSALIIIGILIMLLLIKR